MFNMNLQMTDYVALLKELIKEDRTAIGAVIERITKVLQWFLLASFGISAYLMKPYFENSGTCPVAVVIGADVFLLITSLVFAMFMLYELRFLRRNMEMREDMLKEVIETGNISGDANPFKTEKSRYVFTRDYSIYLNMAIVSLIYIAKINAVLFLFCSGK